MDGTKSECPSVSWDRYCDALEIPEAEMISEWVEQEIEMKVRSIRSTDPTPHRYHFKPEDGWPEDPAVIADEITNMVSNHGVLIEAIVLLARLEREKEKAQAMF